MLYAITNNIAVLNAITNNIAVLYYNYYVACTSKHDAIATIQVEC